MLRPPIVSHLEINIGSGHVAAFQEHEMFHAVAMHEPDCSKKPAKHQDRMDIVLFAVFSISSMQRCLSEKQLVVTTTMKVAAAKTCGQNHNVAIPKTSPVH